MRVKSPFLPQGLVRVGPGVLIGRRQWLALFRPPRAAGDPGGRSPCRRRGGSRRPGGRRTRLAADSLRIGRLIDADGAERSVLLDEDVAADPADFVGHLLVADLLASGALLPRDPRESASRCGEGLRTCSSVRTSLGGGLRGQLGCATFPRPSRRSGKLGQARCDPIRVQPASFAARTPRLPCEAVPVLRARSPEAQRQLAARLVERRRPGAAARHRPAVISACDQECRRDSSCSARAP